MMSQVTSQAAMKIGSMEEKFSEFGKSLNLAELESGVSIYKDLKKGGVPVNDLNINIDVTKALKEGFHQFPELARQDFVSEEMQYVEAAQDNLISNPENASLGEKLVKVTNEAAAHLQDHYEDQWSNPY